jgi:predicted XRE-type DNA-binding protein
MHLAMNESKAARNAMIVELCRTQSQTTVARTFGLTQSRVSTIVKYPTLATTPYNPEK